MTEVLHYYDNNMISISHSYDNHMTMIWRDTFCLQPSRGRPSLCSSRVRSWSSLARSSLVLRYGNAAFVSDIWSLGHQQVVCRVVGHIVALDTSSPSMHRKSRNTRERRDFWSPNRKTMSHSVKAFICCTRISTHEWYRRVLRSVLQSSVYVYTWYISIYQVYTRSRYVIKSKYTRYMTIKRNIYTMNIP